MTTTSTTTLYLGTLRARSDRLYELGDVEAAEVASRLRPVHLDGADAGHARPFTRGSLQLFEIVTLPLSDEFDNAVVPVGHPAREP
jgi:hypothetical protein